MTTKIEIEISTTDRQASINRNIHFDPEAQPAEVLLGRLLYNLVNMFFDLIEVKNEGDEQNEWFW